MPWQLKAASLIGNPVGVSMQNGTGTSGILCGIENGELLLMEYLYHSQFAMKHYPAYTIADVHPFPACVPARYEYSYYEGI
ncbi:hypothetical protein [Paenibacillus sp. YN15]|uniref:hypothetical protein n=1 Tax=Paenibacillus sp. YN15 TaxID=1742774 RepID=UPI000DCC3F0C|nr:hypothetical protein [Paenibacillus sp. YN15]RAU91597.1 hypothetical protein DQG13_29100 [Paenibacillus sp. YN15]